MVSLSNELWIAVKFCFLTLGDKKVWFLSPWFVKDLQIRPFADR